MHASSTSQSLNLPSRGNWGWTPCRWGLAYWAWVGEALCALHLLSGEADLPKAQAATRRHWPQCVFVESPNALTQWKYLQRAWRDNRDEVALALRGTPFQQRVWAALREIPRGQVRTYGELAWQLRSAPRAVGAACGANPVALLVPCHRVVRKSGGLGGFAWGVDTKRALLEAEGVNVCEL